MRIATDTNPLIYALNVADPNHAVAVHAMTTLAAAGDTFCVFPQCLYEFWAVVTKPDKQGVSLLTPTAAHTEIQRYKSLFKYLPDDPNVYDEWERLVVAHQVTGPKSFDTRIVAAMQVHAITHILTFNVKHFSLYPNITVLDPFTV